MESFDTNHHSMSDSFSLYERYLRSFNVVDKLVGVDNNRETSNHSIRPSNCDYESSNSQNNIELSAAVHASAFDYTEHILDPDCDAPVAFTADKILDKRSSLDCDLDKPDLHCLSYTSSGGQSATFVGNSLSDKSDQTPSSDESKPFFKPPVFFSSTMENSNNAVDNVPTMYHNTNNSDTIFKLPITELTFNGTIKHVQNLKPIVDPISALSSASAILLNKELEEFPIISQCNLANEYEIGTNNYSQLNLNGNCSEKSFLDENIEKKESSGDSQYVDGNIIKECQIPISEEGSSSKWNGDQSVSSLEASFDSGVRSPDMFSEGDDEEIHNPSTFWGFVKEFEAYDKRKVRKIEETLNGILPPPSVTTIKTDVSEMLKKYYKFLPSFNSNVKTSDMPIESKETTPSKKVSFIEMPSNSNLLENMNVAADEVNNHKSSIILSKHQGSIPIEYTKTESDLDTSDKSIILPKSSEAEATENLWPSLLKCKHFDVYYNITKYSEKLELLTLRYGERFVGAETDTSVNVHSGGLQSPSSASKRKALRLKLAQVKSPGRRLSHLARRRQAFCSAATISEKAQSTTSKMVLIDKNFFPHRKLINSAERKSPRHRRTPGKKTPSRKTPGKKTPSKTPKSGGSSRKKAMRRLLLDSDSLTRSQPTRETSKRALFISPENRKPIVCPPSTSVPVQAMKSKRNLFGSPAPAETKSMDGTMSDNFLKRKRSMFDDDLDSNRSKIAKSLSFGGDTLCSAAPISIARRASEVFPTKNAADLNETHKKKLLWAVSEALRVHGWRMSSPGFREKASSLARLTRKLLSLPPHAARFNAPKLSTSETMLKLARQYVFAIIQGRSVEDCFQEEQAKLSNEGTSKISGYISATAYQQIKTFKPTISNSFPSKIKENCMDGSQKLEQSRSGSKNVLQDKTVNIDCNSNSSHSSGVSAMLDKSALFNSNSMPSFEEAAKMRARRQISFDNVDFPKR